MLLFQLPPREVAWEKDPSTLTFPLKIQIDATLNPPELFGELEFTDSMRVFPTNENGTQDMRVRGNLFEGPGRIATKTPSKFQKYAFEGIFAGISVEIQGNIATFRCPCPDLLSFYSLIQKIIEEFPSCFACAIPVPVSITWMRGKADEHPFTVRMLSNNMYDSAFSISDEIHQEMGTILEEVFTEAGSRPIQVVAAMRYLSQAFLLESVSKFSYHFVSERMLNVCKAVESITLEAGEKVEDMRTMLRRWSVNERYIDIFASIRYLRSQLDIAHIAYSPLSTGAYRAIQDFLPIAEKCTQSLIITAIRQIKTNPQTYKQYASKGEEPGVIKKLAKYDGVILKGDGDLSNFKS